MAVKTYTVKKDGRVLKTYKSLPSAKQLAEKEMANVYCEGICIYKVVPEEEDIRTADPVMEKTAETPVERQEKSTGSKSTYTRYKLTAKMNVRPEPSFNTRIVTVLDAGAEVDVEKIADDWMCLPDGTYIWYNGGKFAVKTREGE